MGDLEDLGGKGGQPEATGNELPPPPDQQQSQPQAPKSVCLVDVGEEEKGQTTRPHLSREEKGGFPEKWVGCLPL